MTKKKKSQEPEEATAGPEDSAEEVAAEEEATAENVTEEADETEPVDPVLALEEEVGALRDRLLRAVAETENIRRRSEREKIDALSYAVTGFGRDLLSVADNLRRALEAMADHGKLSEQETVFLDGVEMTERELLRVFDQHGIEKISPMGEKFDHNFHQLLIFSVQLVLHIEV